MTETITLSTGQQMPSVGLGTWKSAPGQSLRREDIFVTSKLWNTKHHPDDVEEACKRSLSDLRLCYLDLYLMHWPMAFERGEELMPKHPDGTIRYDESHYRDTWAAMEKLHC
ncbi:aldo-keto reductase family 1 member A1 [Pimephales promelas]|nr:aldo-keto reductase family 1 member A1 [Pimephales promelas]